MKFSEMPVALFSCTRVVPVDSSMKLSEGAVALFKARFPGEFDLLQNGSMVTVKPRNRGDLDKLTFALSTGRAMLASLEAAAPDGSAELQLALFNGEVVDMGTVDVGLDEHAVEASSKALGKRGMRIEILIELITEACVLTHGQNQWVPGRSEQDCYFLFTTGPAADAEFEVDDVSRADSAGPLEAIPPELRSFCIHGDGIRMAVSRKQKSRDEEIFLASRTTRSRAGQSDNAIRLARARLSFSDYTRTGQIRTLTSELMARLLSQESSYLRKWDEYGEAEGKVLLARARAIGVLKYTKVESCTEGMTLILDRPVSGDLSAGDELEITKVVPPYLENPSMEWGVFCGLLEEGAAVGAGRTGQSSHSPEPKQMNPAAESATVVSVSEHSITVDLHIEPPEPSKGFFFVFSMRGERVQIDRRMKARRLVLEGRCANPILGLIIEENGDVPAATKPPPVSALTDFVRRKVFPRTPPTPMQEEAIRVALNTPDIALIQGPPGTGKTTVIAAILERLNEMADKRESIRGQVLLTGFQHDAVENLMLRLAINSLPVPKFGGRNGGSDGVSADLTGERVRQWCDRLATRLRENTPALAMSEQESSLILLCHQYGLAPSHEHALHMLDEAVRLPRNVLGDALAQRLLDLKSLLEAERRSDSEEAGSSLLGLFE